MAETSATKTPHSLNSWQHQLSQLDLPADPKIKSAALQKLQSNTGTAKNVSEVLLHDPALCLLLMSKANQSLNKNDNETRSLTHAISLLGFPRTETLIRRAKVYDKSTFIQLAEYRQQLSISLHAAQQASSFAHLNPNWSQQEIFWATLFQQSPRWAMWYHAGEQMLQLQKLRSQHRGASHQHYEKKILGTTLSALSSSLSRLWHLPASTQQSWQTSISGSARQWIVLSRIAPEKARQALERFPLLQQITSSPSFLIALCNRLADETEWGWQSSRTLRLQKILATALNKSAANVISLSHQQAVIASRQYRLRATLHPAQQLLSFYQKSNTLTATPDTTNQASPPVNIETATSEQSVKINNKNPDKTLPTLLLAGASAEFIEDIERLQQADSFNSIHDVMKYAVSSLCQHMGMERASASLLNLRSKELRTLYSSGCADSPALKNFSHKLQRGDLFNKLLQKPLSVRLHTGNYGQIWPLLPGHFKQACGADQFFMMSIFTNNKPIALIYADQGKSNRPLDDQQYSLFKQLCSAVSHCLQQLTEN